jgi:hypothetical protein
MEHIDLTIQEEAIKQFFLALPSDPEGSMVELNGKPVARIMPVHAPEADEGQEGTAWNGRKNARRCELVDREIARTLLPNEAAELAALQQQMLAERRRLAPVPLNDLRGLHQELLAKAQCVLTWRKVIMASTPLNHASEAKRDETIEQRFRRLEAKWIAETGHLSSYTATIRHPAFREIVNMGEAVIPLMLRDLEKRPGLWVWALHEITGEDPVSAADAGKIGKMTEARLRWGREHGYQW